MIRGAVLRGPGKLGIEEINIPALCNDEILVKVAVNAFCNSTDGHIYKGDDPLLIASQRSGSEDGYPVLIGHEGCGYIVEIGKDVRGFQVGDHVLVVPGKSYIYPGNIITNGGLCAEYAKQPAQNIVKIPLGLSDIEGALAFPLSEVVNSFRTAGLLPGDDVVILGPGPWG